MTKFNWIIETIQKNRAVNYEFDIGCSKFRVAYRDMRYYHRANYIVAIFFQNFNSGENGKYIAKNGEMEFGGQHSRFGYSSIEEAKEMCERMANLLVLV